MKIIDSIKPYKRIAIRGGISICVIAMDFVIKRLCDKFVHIDDVVIEYIWLFLRVAIIFVALRNLVQAIGEFEQSKDADTEIKIHTKEKDTYNIPIDKVISLSEENDIIEFMIIADDKKIKMGASSDYEYNKFFDKRYYIGKQEYENIAEFRERVQEISDTGTLKVVSIDGVSPKYYK